MNETKTPVLNDIQQDFLSKLRASTDIMHKKLESSRLSINLLKKDVSLAEYGTYLSHMHNVIAFCEEQVFPVIANIFPDIEQRRKLPLIAQDIEVLQQLTTIPQADIYGASIDPANIPFAVGYMYVIEGSTLGGRILLNHIKTALGLDEKNGASFFAGYNADTGRLWKAFLDIFSRYSAEDDHAEEVIAGARYAFSSIENYFA